MKEKPDDGLLEIADQDRACEPAHIAQPVPLLHSTVNFDPADYMAELDGIDITEAQKTELLEILWSIMASFVRLGFDVKICEQIFDAAGIIPGAQGLRVECQDASKSKNKMVGEGPRGSHD